VNAHSFPGVAETSAEYILAQQNSLGEKAAVRAELMSWRRRLRDCPQVAEARLGPGEEPRRLE
jgi:hypothetical protein